MRAFSAEQRYKEKDILMNVRILLVWRKVL